MRRRLADALHDLREPLLALHNAEVTTPVDPNAPAQAFPTALIRLSDVVICHPVEDATAYARAAAGARVRKEQVVSQVTLQASGMTLRGDMHLPADITLADYLTARASTFLPVTDIRVSWGRSDFVAPSALVNTAQVAAFFMHAESLAFRVGDNEPAAANDDRRYSVGSGTPHTGGRVWVPSRYTGRTAEEGLVAAG